MKSPKKHTETQKRPSTIQLEIIEKLAYSAVFNHPLRVSEIQNVLHNYYSYQSVERALNILKEAQCCYEFDGYFSLAQNVETEIKNRHEFMRQAGIFFNRLPKFARIISGFPFVRGVAISGSLSKGVIHNHGDVDYFIITSHRKLWLARMLLILYKKTVLLNSRKYFCVNYFISEKALEIPDKNIFTATEINTLIPIYGKEYIHKFKVANIWIKTFYGHFEHPIKIDSVAPRWPRIKMLFEWLLNNKFGNKLDLLFMNITWKRWKQKFPNFDAQKFELTMRSKRDVSKHHPSDFQTHVLQQVETKKAAIILKFASTL